MSDVFFTNTAIVQRGNVKKEAKASFQILNDLNLSITKTVDREDKIYYVGDPIIFTITITRNSDYKGTINQIKLTDEIPPMIGFDPKNVTIIEGNSTKIDVSGNNISIDNIVLNDPKPVFKVQITGIVKQP